MTKPTKPAAQLSVKDLANELVIEVEALLPLLAKMGLKDASSDTSVPEAIAQNARAAAKARNNTVALPQSASRLENENEGEEISRKLKKNEVKAIAQDTGLTQVVVRGLDKAMHDRECQLAFLEAFNQVERGERLQEARDAGTLAAKLSSLQKRKAELDDRESEILEEGLEDKSGSAIAKGIGYNLEAMLESLEQSSNETAKKQLDRDAAIRTINEGGKPSEESLSDPFVKLAYRRYRGR